MEPMLKRTTYKMQSNEASAIDIIDLVFSRTLTLIWPDPMTAGSPVISREVHLVGGGHECLSLLVLTCASHINILWDFEMTGDKSAGFLWSYECQAVLKSSDFSACNLKSINLGHTHKGKQVWWAKDILADLKFISYLPWDIHQSAIFQSESEDKKQKQEQEKPLVTFPIHPVRMCLLKVSHIPLSALTCTL